MTPFQRAFDAALRVMLGGERAVLMLIGEPGIGKTRQLPAPVSMSAAGRSAFDNAPLVTTPTPNTGTGLSASQPSTTAQPAAGSGDTGTRGSAGRAGGSGSGSGGVANTSGSRAALGGAARRVALAPKGLGNRRQAILSQFAGRPRRARALQRTAAPALAALVGAP